jgi:hypothetical protein
MLLVRQGMFLRRAVGACAVPACSPIAFSLHAYEACTITLPTCTCLVSPPPHAPKAVPCT